MGVPQGSIIGPFQRVSCSHRFITTRYIIIRILFKVKNVKELNLGIIVIWACHSGKFLEKISNPQSDFVDWMRTFPICYIMWDDVQINKSTTINYT